MCDRLRAEKGRRRAKHREKEGVSVASYGSKRVGTKELWYNTAGMAAEAR